MAVTKVTTKVLADDAVTIDKIADAALVTETEGISSNDNDTTIPTSAAVKDYVDTQDATKEDTITGAATTITSSDLTASKALVSNASGKVAASTITDTELGHLSGVSSNVQDQFDALTDNDTTYTIAAADGDNADEEKIVLTGSDASTDEVVLEAGTGLSISRSGDKITFTNTVTDTDTVLTAEQVEDIVGAMVSSNSETGITVSYDDTNGKIDFSVDSQTDENFTSALKTKLEGISSGAEVNQNAFSTIAVSGQTSVNSDSNTDTLNLAAGTGITLTTDAGTDTVTITSTATGSVTEAFKTISVSGQSDVVADGATDTLTLAAGSNITLTTDAATDTITIASTASGGGGGGTLDIEQDTFDGDGTTGPFSLTSTCSSKNNLQVYIDGVYQSKDNFSVSGTSLTFTTAPNTGTDNIEVMHLKSVVGKIIVDTSTSTGSTSHTINNSITNENNTQVYVDGVYQSKDNYTTSGTTITFSTAPPSGSIIEVVHIVPDSTGGGITWVTPEKTANFGATAGEGYFVNTTSAAITVTLPGSPTAGDEVSIIDYAGTADTNNITITSSDKINGSSSDVLIDYERGGVSMVYVDATQGWIAYNAANETATALPVDLPPLTVDYLVVAGGGSGTAGAYSGGGGGAGGLRTSYTNSSSLNGHTESSLSLTTALNYTVTVGPGGAAPATSTIGNNGNNSKFGIIGSEIISTGGGGGGGRGNANGNNNGLAGGSGGGGASTDGSGSTTFGGTAVTTPVTQGYAGGGNGGFNSANFPAGGGGGAGAVGGNATGVNVAGNGGAGLAVNILNTTNAATESVGEVSGSDVYYSGGGGGSVYATGHTAGTGGLGGGGDAVNSNINAPNSAPNTGGGGGSSVIGYSGGNGGSGVVIVRYPDAYTITETTSPTVLTFNTYIEGTDKVTVFTGGDGTIQFS